MTAAGLGHRYKADRGRWKSFYEEISSINKVILVSYKTDSQELMMKADAILGLNGTSALEATLKYNKYSFVFSENPFLGLPGIIRINSVNEFKSEFNL